MEDFVAFLESANRCHTGAASLTTAAGRRKVKESVHEQLVVSCGIVADVNPR
jgi:HD-like signal output (HDOD) protein